MDLFPATSMGLILSPRPSIALYRMNMHNAGIFLDLNLGNMAPLG